MGTTPRISLTAQEQAALRSLLDGTVTSVDLTVQRGDGTRQPVQLLAADPQADAAHSGSVVHLSDGPRSRARPGRSRCGERGRRREPEQLYKVSTPVVGSLPAHDQQDAITRFNAFLREHNIEPIEYKLAPDAAPAADQTASTVRSATLNQTGS